MDRSVALLPPCVIVQSKSESMLDKYTNPTRMCMFNLSIARYVCYNIYKFLRLHDFCKVKSKVKVIKKLFPRYLVFYSIQR